MMSIETAREMFYYDRNSGILRRRVSYRGFDEGAPVGSLSGKRLRVKMFGVHYFVHRLIWFIETGSWPNNIDHINGNSMDNRWENLRDTTFQENNMNKALMKNNTSGVCGVYFTKNNHWGSYIRDRGKSVHLYWGDDFFEACCVRKSAETRLGYHQNHGRTAK